MDYCRWRGGRGRGGDDEDEDGAVMTVGGQVKYDRGRGTISKSWGRVQVRHDDEQALCNYTVDEGCLTISDDSSKQLAMVL